MSKSNVNEDYLSGFKKAINRDDFNRSCLDILSFQAKFQKLRQFDDKIINILNTELPTESFHKDGRKFCQQFKLEVDDYYDLRESLIDNCLKTARKELADLAAQKDADSSNSLGLRNAIREKNYLVRQFQQELEIEKISRIRTNKVVHERCRNNM